MRETFTLSLREKKMNDAVILALVLDDDVKSIVMKAPDKMMGEMAQFVAFYYFMRQWPRHASCELTFHLKIYSHRRKEIFQICISSMGLYAVPLFLLDFVFNWRHASQWAVYMQHFLFQKILYDSNLNRRGFLLLFIDRWQSITRRRKQFGRDSRFSYFFFDNIISAVSRIHFPFPRT